MSNERKSQRNVTEGIKETAGAAFHTLHSALETTENAAMSAVDATTEALKNITGRKNRNREQQ